MSRRPIHQTDPTMIGRAGRAWALDAAAIGANRTDDRPRPPSDLSVASWIVHAPGAHPLWHSYAVLGVSLRELDGAPPAELHRPGMTHEVIVFALDPSVAVYADEVPPYLQGPNYVGQFIAGDDDEAAARIRAAVAEIVAGQLSPDSDYVRMWRARFEPGPGEGAPCI